jgi:predicted component of type VI protein secretion system
MRATITIQDSQGGTARQVEWDGSRCMLGRSSACDIQVDRSVVSGHHLTFDTQGHVPVVVDAGSTNGTQIGGEPLSAGIPRPLESGDRLSVGDLRIEIAWSAPTEDLDDLTAEADGDFVADLFGAPSPEGGSLEATLDVVTSDGATTSHVLPDDAGPLLIGSDSRADIALPFGCPSAFASLKRTDTGFDLVPADEGGQIDTRISLSDGWSHHFPQGARLIFRDPLESQLGDLDGPEDVPEDTSPSTPTPAPSTSPAASTEIPSGESVSKASTTDTVIIGALLVLLTGALSLVALFFDLL